MKLRRSWCRPISARWQDTTLLKTWQSKLWYLDREQVNSCRDYLGGLARELHHQRFLAQIIAPIDRASGSMKSIYLNIPASPAMKTMMRRTKRTRMTMRMMVREAPGPHRRGPCPSASSYRSTLAACGRPFRGPTYAKRRALPV